MEKQKREPRNPADHRVWFPDVAQASRLQNIGDLAVPVLRIGVFRGVTGFDLRSHFCARQKRAWFAKINPAGTRALKRCSHVASRPNAWVEANAKSANGIGMILQPEPIFDKINLI
jgi:hypothetical protein